MKKYFIILAGLLLIGCSYQGKDLESYVNDPASIIQDPHYASYKDNKDAIESRYLRKEISYADYIKQTQELDDKYNQEVKSREKKLDLYSAEEK